MMGIGNVRALKFVLHEVAITHKAIPHEHLCKEDDNGR